MSRKRIRNSYGSPGEPKYDPNNQDEFHFSHVLNWYSQNRSSKDAKKYLIEYLESIGTSNDQIKHIKKVSEKSLVNTAGWLSRIHTRSGTLPENGIQHLNKYVSDALAQDIDVDSDEESSEPKIGVQERIKLQVATYVGEIDEHIDLFIEKITKSINPVGMFDSYSFLKEKYILPIQTTRIIEHYETTILKELKDARSGKCPQLKEAYSYLKKIQLEYFITFIEGIIEGAQKWYDEVRHETKATRKPRKRKIKTPEQLVSKIKIQNEYPEYDLKSLNPTKLVGANQLWVFNTKTRFLGIYVCNNPHGLSIKGTTLLNFDEKESFSKKVRKPKEVLPKILQGGKIACKKMLSQIKAKEKYLNGRLNSDTILLKVIQ